MMTPQHGTEPKAMANLAAEALANATTTASTKPQPLGDWRPPLDLWHSSLITASEQAHRLASEAAASLAVDPMAGRWLTLTGVAGCGKSALADYTFGRIKALSPYNGPRTFGGGHYNAEPPRRPRCVWMTESSFAEKMRGGREYDLPEYLSEDWLVCLDDLGASRDKTEYVADAVYRLCQARLGKWTIFTTNFTLQEVADRMDQRIASRLIRDDNVVHQITAGDYALRRRST